MARELSAVLDHVARIGELDLDDVAPTSHVVEIDRRAAPRRAAPVPAARGRARAGARGQRRRFPSPQPAGMSDSPRAAPLPQAAEAIAAGLAVRRRSCSTSTARVPPPTARRERTGSTASPGSPTGDGAARPARGAPLGGVPLAVKDLFCTEGVPSQSGSRILEGYLPPYTATVVARLRDAGHEPAGEDQPGRVRDGLLQRELRVRRRAQPVGPRARARRLLRRQRRRRRRRPGAVGARHRHRRLDPPARRAVRDRRAETHLRLRLALRHDRVRLLARPGRARSRATCATPR